MFRVDPRNQTKKLNLTVFYTPISDHVVLSVIAGIGSAFLGIISADVLGLVETLLLANLGHFISQICFATAIFTNSFVHLAIGRSLDTDPL